MKTFNFLLKNPIGTKQTIKLDVESKNLEIIFNVHNLRTNEKTSGMYSGETAFHNLQRMVSDKIVKNNSVISITDANGNDKKLSFYNNEF